MSTTIGETVSRVRNTLKAVKEDAFLTDRFVYSVISKYAKLFIKRQDNLNKLLRFKSFFRALPCVPLIEVDKIEACCAGIKSGCIIMRTENKLPSPFEGPYGPMFRTVSSIDGSQEIVQTEPGTYTSMTKTTTFKYNKTKYYWYLDGYMYFPNIEWDAVKIEGIWENSIDEKECILRQDQQSNIPDDLFAEIEQQVLQELTMSINIPADSSDDKQNALR